VVALVALAVAACNGGDDDEPAYPLDDELRINDVQVLGTHNSFHVETDVPLPGPVGDEMEYTHVPLEQQLDEQGVRAVELDVYDHDGEFPVLHSPVVDDRSTCSPLEECLTVLADWSARHDGHVPIFVLIEPREQSLVLDPTFEPLDAGDLDRLDEVVVSALGAENLVTPDDVRGDSPTLRDAIVEDGWPALAESRGRFLVVLSFGGGDERDDYLAAHPTLEGRPMFVMAEPSSPAAAVVAVDEPDEAAIGDLVEEGFIVRTRADAELAEPRAGDVTRRDLAFASGAQIVSTDVPVVDPTLSDTYVVQVPGGRPARCNPVTAPPDCRAVDIENPAHLRSD